MNWIVNKKTMFGVALLFATSFSVNAAKYSFKVANADPDSKVILTWRATGEKDTVNIINGEGIIEKKDFKAQYVIFAFGRSSRMMYLEPDKDLTISFNANEFNKDVVFQGANAGINTYLNTSRFKRQNFQDAQKDEKAFINHADSIYHVNMTFLQNTPSLPAYFVKIESQRLKYLSYSQFPLYPSFRKYLLKTDSLAVNEIYYDKLKELSEVNGALLDCPEYKDFILNSILGQMLKNGKAADYQQQFIDYVSANVKDEAVLEYIVDSYIYNQVSNNGVDNADKYISFYHQTVKNPLQINRFNKLCMQWEKLKKGSISPTFSCLDINGNRVSLSDLKGKLVYIDVWATWCGPCRGELPHLKKLEETFAEKEISFVSISCDKDKKAWEKMVKSRNMKGIQLHIGDDRSFMDAYLIKGIPRFILLDQEGRIVEADAMRPSNPKISELFNELLSK